MHGTLYSILSRHKILDQARACGLEDMLQAVSDASEPVFQRQIEYILRKLQDTSALGDTDEAESLDGEVGDDELEDDVEYDEGNEGFTHDTPGITSMILGG